MQKATTGATTDYHYDLTGHLIGESDDSTGNNLREYVYMEGEPLAQIDSSGNIFFLHTNQVKLPQKITDASRNLVFDQIIEPFGEVSSTPTSTDPTNIQFPGQYADAENLLSYNMNRNYDTTLGRFPEADPSGFRGGLNLFAYGGNNPTQNIDPYGLDQFSFTIGAGPGLSATIGYNNGQYNAGAWFGMGYGASASWDFSNAEVESAHAEIGTLLDENIGVGVLGGDATIYSSSQDSEVCLSAGIPKTPLGAMIGIKNGDPEAGSAWAVGGVSSFVGTGSKIYFPLGIPPPQEFLSDVKDFFFGDIATPP